MNNRIKLLVEQATTEEHDGFRYFDKQKFAKLIAIECMKLCTDVKEDLFTIEDNDKRDMAEMAATFCYEAIKCEFGVEE
jgi:hypothetical protein